MFICGNLFHFVSYKEFRIKMEPGFRVKITFHISHFTFIKLFLLQYNAR